MTQRSTISVALVLVALFAPALAGIMYRQGTTCVFGVDPTSAPIPGDLAMARGGKCLPWAYPSEYKFMKMQCDASGQTLTATAYEDSSCTTAVGNSSVAMAAAVTYVDPAGTATVYRPCTVFQVAPIATGYSFRNYFAFTNCNTSTPEAYDPTQPGMAVGLVATTGALATSCDAFSKSTPVILLPSRTSCPATTNALVNMFVSAPSAADSAARTSVVINMCASGGTIIDKVTVPMLAAGSQCQVTTVAGVSIAYQFIGAPVFPPPTSAAARTLASSVAGTPQL